MVENVKFNLRENRAFRTQQWSIHIAEKNLNLSIALHVTAIRWIDFTEKNKVVV